MHESPHFLNFGQHPSTIVDAITKRDESQSVNVHGYAEDLCAKLQKVHEQVRFILKRVNEERQEEIEKSTDNPLKIGDEVFLHDPTTPLHRSKKFIKRWTGPHVIIRKHNNNTSVIMVNETERLVSNDRLRLVRDGLETIEEKHQSAVQRALEEIKVIDEHVRDLVERKRKLTLIREISYAVIALETSDSGTLAANSSVNPSDESAREDSVEDENLYDEDEDESEEVHIMAYSLVRADNLC